MNSFQVNRPATMSSTFPTVRSKKTAALRPLRSPSHGSSTDGSQEWTSRRHAIADKRLNRERSRSTERLSTLSNISEPEINQYSKLEEPLKPLQTDTIKIIELTQKKHEQILARTQRQNDFLTSKYLELCRQLKRVQRERKCIDRALMRIEAYEYQRQMAGKFGVFTFDTPLLHLGVNSLQQGEQQEGCSQKCELQYQEELQSPMLFSQMSFTFKREAPSGSQHWDGEEAPIHRASSRLHAEDEEFIKYLAQYTPEFSQEDSA